MYENVGGKIKVLAKVITTIGIVVSFLAFVASCRANIIIGLLVLIIGIIISWLSTLVLYAFGELVENSAICARELQEINGKLPYSYDDDDSED